MTPTVIQSPQNPAEEVTLSPQEWAGLTRIMEIYGLGAPTTSNKEVIFSLAKRIVAVRETKAWREWVEKISPTPA